MESNNRMYLMSSCSPLHGKLIQVACDVYPVDIEVMYGSTASSVRTGLCSVNNDACYETIASVGKLLEAYDRLDCPSCAVVTPRLCADCRSMDTAAFAARAFRKTRDVEIEVLDATRMLQAAKTDEGLRLQRRIGLALWSGDIITQSLSMLRPGSSETAREKAATFEEAWMERARAVVSANDLSAFSRFCEQTTAEAFEAMGPDDRKAPEIGLVGSAPVLYDAYMNAGAISEFEREGCRVSVPTLSGYVRWETASVAQETELGLQLGRLGAIVRGLDLPLRRLTTRVRLHSSVAGVVPESLRYGDGWRIAAQIAHEAEQGVRNFVYVSTFGCLSGHIMGKGVLRWARGLAPNIHVSAIEYDPGTSAVNQANRIKLIASIAKNSVLENDEIGFATSEAV